MSVAGSESDAGSVANGGLREDHHDDDHDLLDTNQGPEAAVFGVIYTVTKVRYERNWTYAVARILVDFFQLFLLIANPAYGWNINRHLWLWKWITYLQFETPITSRGYSFYISTMYLVMGVLLLCGLLLAYAGWGFKADRFPIKWPIRLLRFLLVFFGVTFYVATLHVFLPALDCNFLHPRKKFRFHLNKFHHPSCMAFPHLVHMGVAALAVVLLVIVALALALGDVEVNPLSSNLLGAATSMVQLRVVILQTIIVFASRFGTGHHKLQSCLWAWRSGFCAGRSSIGDPDYAKQKLKDIYKFSEDYQVEVLTRCCRAWNPEDETLDPAAVDLAELIIKAGMARFGNQASLMILYCNFLVEVQSLYQNGLSHLQAAKKLHPNVMQRYVIFAWEQIHRQRAQSQSAGESSVDLAGYVEFQKNLRSVMRSHKAALLAYKRFWRLLLHHHVHLSSLTKELNAIESTQKRAEKAYLMIAERYPSSAKVLRMYGRFLEDIKNDPWQAAKLYTEADKAEEDSEKMQGMTANNSDFNEEDAAMVGQLNDKNSGVVLINATGVIQMVNKLALTTFGYKKSELEGKNVSMLMPQPFSQRHDVFLRNYIQTGKPKVINKVMEYIALHKDRHVFPIRAAITKAAGTGSDSVFMGMIVPCEDHTESVRAWVMPNGIILCINERFTDWFGKLHADILGQAFYTLAVEQDKLEIMLDHASMASVDDFKQGKVSAEGINMMHKYMGTFECDIECRLGGTDGQRLLVMDITRKAVNKLTNSMLVCDAKGKIIFVTSALAQLLGYKPTEMVDHLTLFDLMNPPFCHLHEKWIVELPSKVTLSSCRNNATVVAVTQNRSSIPVRMAIEVREDHGNLMFVVSMWKSHFNEGLNLRRLSTHINPEGLVLEATESPMALFGIKPSALVGHGVHEFIDTVADVLDRGMTQAEVLQGLIARAQAVPGISFRVGLHSPISEQLAQELQTSQTAAAIWKTQVKPAVLELQVKESYSEEIPPDVTLHLNRSDAITAIIETDRSGRITKAGCCPLHLPGLVFGCPTPSMLRQPLSKYVDLEGSSIGDALLADHEPAQDKKKVASRGRTHTGIKLGNVCKMSGFHTDGQQLTLHVQAVPKDLNRHRIVVKISPIQVSKGNARVLQEALSFVPDFGDELLGMAEDGYPRRSSLSMIPSSVPEGNGGRQRRSSYSLPPPGATGPLHQWHHLGQGNPAGGGGRQVNPDVPSKPALLDDDATAAAAAEANQDDVDLAELAPDARAGKPERDDAASSDSGSHSDGASIHSMDHTTTDYRKGKRLKKLTKMLSGRRAQLAITLFHRQTYILLAVQLFFHLVCFIMFLNFLKSLNQYVYELDAAGRASDIIHRMAMNSLILRELHKGHSVPGIFNTSEIPRYTEMLRSKINEFEVSHHGIYLGFHQTRHLKNIRHASLRSLWEDQVLNASTLADLRMPELHNLTSNLWEIGNTYMLSAREVMSNHARMAGNDTLFNETTYDLRMNRFWHFVNYNGPYVLFETYKVLLDLLVTRAREEVDRVNVVNLVLMIVEGCVMGAVAAISMWVLVQRVLQLRYRLFSTFLVIPPAFLRLLAVRRLQIDDDDAEGAQSDDDEVVMEDVDPTSAMLVQAPPGVQDITSGVGKLQLETTIQGDVKPAQPNLLRSWMAVVNTLMLGQADISGGRLTRDTHDTLKVVVPFLLWTGLLLFIYANSYQTLHMCASFLVSNALADSVLFRIMRVVFFSLSYCTSQSSAEREAIQPMVLHSVKRLDHAYRVLMYGNHDSDNMDTSYASPGSAFTKDAPVAFFFRSKGKCWRTNQAGCANATNEYYQVSRNGLDNMIMRLLEDASLLSRDSEPWVNMSSTRIAYIWKVANYDLHEGMEQATTHFTRDVIAAFTTTMHLHVVLFILSWVMAIGFIVFIFKPFLHSVQADGHRVASLLSHLPADLDVEALLSSALALKDEGEDGDGGGNRDSSSTGRVLTDQPGFRRSQDDATDSQLGDGEEAAAEPKPRKGAESRKHSKADTGNKKRAKFALPDDDDEE